MLRKLPGGLQYEERAEGPPGDIAREGQKVEIKFSIRLAGKVHNEKVVERGEIQCQLGKEEVLDGWVDGNCDIEEVLATWGQAVVGMRSGGNRRVHIPVGKGFRKRGGEAAGSSTPLLFDVQLRKLLP